MIDEQAHHAVIAMKNRTVGFIWFFITTTMMSVGLGFIWCMSPLGFGFAEWPTDPSIRSMAFAIYWMSYFIGIPLLLVGQVISAILAIMGRLRAAFRIPIVSIGLFLISAATTLAFVSLGH